jgi:hypothetical protein
VDSRTKVALLALVGLLLAVGIGVAAYAVSKDSVGLPVTKLDPKPLAPTTRTRPATTTRSTTTRAQTTTQATTTVDDHGGGGGGGGDNSGPGGGGGGGHGGDD